MDVNGEPRRTGNGFAPGCPISVSPDVGGGGGVVAAVRGTAAAAQHSSNQPFVFNADKIQHYTG